MLLNILINESYFLYGTQYSYYKTKFILRVYRNSRHNVL